MQLDELTNLQKAQEAAVEFIAFSGGGAKGAEYSGVYSGLSSAGIIDGVKAVAGSSAGSIVAALVATGMKTKEFEKISKEISFKELLGKGNFFGLEKDGQPFYDFLDKAIRQNVQNFFEENALDTLLQSHSAQEIANINELKERCVKQR